MNLRLGPLGSSGPTDDSPPNHHQDVDARATVLEAIVDRAGITRRELDEWLQLDPDIFNGALRALLRADRIQTRQGSWNDPDTRLFTNRTVEFWDNKETRALFEDSYLNFTAFYVTVHPGRTFARMAASLRKPIRARVALYRLARRGLIERRRVHGKVEYWPTETLWAWAHATQRAPVTLMTATDGAVIVVDEFLDEPASKESRDA